MSLTKAPMEDADDSNDVVARTNGKQYTAAFGKDRFDHCRGKSLIYQTSDPRPTTPVRHGKKGAPGAASHAQAPFATLEELGSASSKAPQLTSMASLERKASSDTGFAQGGGTNFDPAVYAANRAANLKMKEESARRNFIGNGNILSHPVGDVLSST